MLAVYLTLRNKITEEKTVIVLENPSDRPGDDKEM